MSGQPAALLSNDPRLPAILDRVRGGSALIKESKALGFTHNGPLRTALRELIGSAQYERMMAEPAKERKAWLPAPAAPQGKE